MFGAVTKVTRFSPHTPRVEMFETDKSSMGLEFCGSRRVLDMAGGCRAISCRWSSLELCLMPCTNGMCWCCGGGFPIWNACTRYAICVRSATFKVGWHTPGMPGGSGASTQVFTKSLCNSVSCPAFRIDFCALAATSPLG